MTLLTTSDLAAVSVNNKIHLFYQSFENEIVEVSSEDGKSWSKESTIKDGVWQGNPAFTVFGSVKDATNGNKASIHVIYIDQSSKIREQVRSVDDKTWKELPIPSGLPAPINTSKISSGICHDSGNGHHWIFFSSLQDGLVHVVELRKESNGGNWVERKDLPQEFGTSLSGTAIATSLTNPTTFMLFQASNKDIFRVEGGYEKWDESKTKVVVLGSQTIHRSPLASCIDSSGSTEKYYMFFVGDVDGKNHVQSLIDGKRTTIAVWTPGSFIGAAMHNGKPHLFVNEVFQAVPRLSTYAYDGSSWTSLGAVNTN